MTDLLTLLLAVVATATPLDAETLIPVQLEQGLMLAEVRVAGSRPMTFIVDTGAETTVVDQAAARRSAVRGGKALVASAQGGEVEAIELPKVDVAVGALSLGRIDAVAIDLGGLSSGLGRRIDGILGQQFFRGRTVRLDYAGRRIGVSPSRPPKPGAATFPIAVRGGTPFIAGHIIQHGAAIPGQFLIDTGAVGATTLNASFLTAHPDVVPARTLSLTAGGLKPGAFAARAGRVERVAAGPFVAASPVATLSSNAAGDDAEEGEAGLIGAQILARSAIIIDYDHGWIEAAPSAPPRPFRFDASGLSLRSEAPDYSAKIVRLVLAGSPAKRAGIVAGDRIVSVDGRGAERVTMAGLRALLQLPGRAHRLVLRRGARLLTRTIVTRTLI